MNAREEARRMAEVMLAFADGADVQYRLHDDEPWNDTVFPNWNWDRWDYRVKPKPREAWVVFDQSHFPKAAICVESEARELAERYGFSVVHMREVTE